jgi:hypothetical protein
MIDCIDCSKAQNRLYRFLQGEQPIIAIVPKRKTDYINYIKHHNRLHRYRYYRDIYRDRKIIDIRSSALSQDSKTPFFRMRPDDQAHAVHILQHMIGNAPHGLALKI